MIHLEDISAHVWKTKYCNQGEKSVEESWQRVARALAEVENDRPRWQKEFYQLLSDFAFLPGGRILAGAGTDHIVTLFNCFVMGTIEDSMAGIFEGLKEGALTMQQGGGVGYDFSTLRPRGMENQRTGTIASGPVSFMKIWNAMCDTILSTGARRGAMMATLRCDHPDIEEFIEAKRHTQQLNHFNLSVLVSDRFMKAVSDDIEWPLVFPDEAHPVKTVQARALWDKIMTNTYEHAEPGVLFIDRINQWNNLWYCEQISATNPCGEIPLAPYGACDLGSFNLTAFVDQPFTERASFNYERLRQLVPVAVRFLDNVIDISRFPLPRQKQRAYETRRLGLGITGLADALIFMNLRYDSAAALAFAEEVIKTICYDAYEASIALAEEKGAFPLFERKKYLQGAFVEQLPEAIRRRISHSGMRNSHVLAIAPTGTISLLANNISSGIEPIFDYEVERSVLDFDGCYKTYSVKDYAFRQWQKAYGDRPLPAAFVSAQQLEPNAHLKVQAVFQKYVDNSISKTINIPENYGFESFKQVYHVAYQSGAKGCTTFRPNPYTGAILKTKAAASVCCDIDREAD